jgi:glucose-1-phosphate cytidylyltransferase
MKAVILCGGMGTRLREQTETKPKPMVEVGGRPILWHIMKIYSSFGISDYVLCLGYKGDVIKKYFLDFDALNSDFTVTLGSERRVEVHRRETNEQENWRVTLLDTGRDAMTGARVARAVDFMDESDGTFALTYGDGVGAIDVSAILEFHRSHGRLATVTGVRPPSRFGELRIEGGRVRSFSEKPQVEQGLINGGFFFLEPGFRDYLSTDDSCILERTPLERCARDGQLMVYEHGGYWQCMDTYRDWKQLEANWQSGAAPWKTW